ncbi:MAG: hypothetical protein QM725_12005 [Lacibacter sp.]
MKKSIKYQRKIIAVEKKLGFLYFPAQGQEFMPAHTTKVAVVLEGTTKSTELSYNADHKRIFGLTNWYNKNGVTVGTSIHVELTKEQIKLSVSKSEITIPYTEDETDLIDL